MTNDPGQFILSPAQGIQLMCLAEMMRAGDLDIRGDDRDIVQQAKGLILDVSQEIALQVQR